MNRSIAIVMFSNAHWFGYVFLVFGRGCEEGEEAMKGLIFPFPNKV